jgi:UDP-GlcNAc:undecaprenyl-phosphate/decaprenyl-phosphate GlcNAc-1-phosphate transferase
MRQVPTVQRETGSREVSEAQKTVRSRASALAIRFCQALLFSSGIYLAFTVSQGHLDQTQIPGFLCALAVSWWLTPEIRTRAMRLGLVDKPGEERRIHKVAVPRLGGVAIYISIMVALVIMMAICGRFPRQGGLLGIAAGGTLIFVMGLLDDLESIPAKVKLAIQMLAAFAAYSLGVRINARIPLPFNFDFAFIHINGGIDVGQFAFPLTILWLVAIPNAVNLIDGMDGLAAGVSLISAITIWSIAMSPDLHQPYAAWIAAVLAGALLGFLRWNFNPARIFLGDSGAYLAGFMLGAVAITGVMKTATVVTVLLPMLILFFPLLDTSWAIVRRLARGQSIFAPDADHIHHRLLRTGLSQKRVAYLIYALCAVLGLAASWMVGQQYYYLSVCGVVLALALFFAEVLNRNRGKSGNKNSEILAPDEPGADESFQKPAVNASAQPTALPGPQIDIVSGAEKIVTPSSENTIMKDESERG